MVANGLAVLTNTTDVILGADVCSSVANAKLVDEGALHADGAVVAVV